MLNLSLHFSSSKPVFLHNFCLDDKRESGLFKKKRKMTPLSLFCVCSPSVLGIKLLPVVAW